MQCFLFSSFFLLFAFLSSPSLPMPYSLYLIWITYLLSFPASFLFFHCLPLLPHCPLFFSFCSHFLSFIFLPTLYFLSSLNLFCFLPFLVSFSSYALSSITSSFTLLYPSVRFYSPSFAFLHPVLYSLSAFLLFFPYIHAFDPTVFHVFSIHSSFFLLFAFSLPPLPSNALFLPPYLLSFLSFPSYALSSIASWLTLLSSLFTFLPIAPYSSFGLIR